MRYRGNVDSGSEHENCSSSQQLKKQLEWSEAWLIMLNQSKTADLHVGGASCESHTVLEKEMQKNQNRSV